MPDIDLYDVKKTNLLMLIMLVAVVMEEKNMLVTKDGKIVAKQIWLK